MAETNRDVIVVGGGISGLTTAWQLDQQGADVLLLEAQEAVGGCTQSERRDGFLLEKGPFNVIVRDPAFEDLLTAMAGKVRVVTASKAARDRFLYRHGQLMKVPTSPFALAGSKLLSGSAKLRLLRGMLFSRAARGEETIEQAATRRLGAEVADTMVSAVVSGIFGGDIRRLSLPACFPSAGAVDRSARSPIGYLLTKGMGPAKKTKSGEKWQRKWRGLVSVDAGLGGLMEAMGEQLGPNLRRGTTVVRISALARAEDGARFELTCRSARGAESTMRCRRLVLATGAPQTAKLLEHLAPVAVRELEQIESVSLCVLNLAFDAKDVGHPLQGFGFLVPRNEPDLPVMGILWADSIFPHHVPDGKRLIRVFIGGARDPLAVDRSDDDLLARAMGTARKLLDVRGEPKLVDISRWRRAIPQYYPGHVERIGRARAAVARVPGLVLVGNYLEGVSLNDCVRLGTRVADELAGEGQVPAGKSSAAGKNAAA